MNGFQRIVKKIPENSSMIDIGGWGLGGENTSQFLQERFGKNVVFFNKEQIGHKVDIVADFYTYNFTKQYDVIVLDMNDKDNIERDWTFDNFCKIYNLLNPKGIFITYIITNYLRLEYQDIKFSELFNILAIFPEGRRDNIVWVAFRKKDV